MTEKKTSSPVTRVIAAPAATSKAFGSVPFMKDAAANGP